MSVSLTKKTRPIFFIMLKRLQCLYLSQKKGNSITVLFVHIKGQYFLHMTSNLYRKDFVMRFRNLFLCLLQWEFFYLFFFSSIQDKSASLSWMQDEWDFRHLVCNLQSLLCGVSRHFCLPVLFLLSRVFSLCICNAINTFIKTCFKNK